MGPGVTRAKFPIKPKTKLSVKWRMKEGFVPSGLGCIILDSNMAKDTSLG
jgi:hypothetical protein